MKVTCGVHGGSEARFVCNHILKANERVGFIITDDGEVAWCRKCDDALEAGADVNRLFLKYGVTICERCFDRLKSRCEDVH